MSVSCDVFICPRASGQICEDEHQSQAQVGLKLVNASTQALEFQLDQNPEPALSLHQLL